MSFELRVIQQAFIKLTVNGEDVLSVEPEYYTSKGGRQDAFKERGQILEDFGATLGKMSEIIRGAACMPPPDVES
jgi:hypothetical protein